MRRNWTILFIIFLTTVFLSFVAPEKCELLRDGKYLMKYTIPTEAFSTLQIKNNAFIQYFPKSDTLKGQIKSLSNCRFQLIYGSEWKPDTSDIGKLINKSFGETVIELTEAGSDTITFRTTYIGNVHITVDKGKLIRLN
jgi:hypothetical protein